MPRAVKVILFLLVLLLAAGYWGVRTISRGPELRSETVALRGLDEPVEILYDSLGVPHIYASSLGDLFFAQGWVHARHRLWQMEMFRRVLQGRLSEIFGERTLETDRFLRTIGMEEAARAGLPHRNTPIYKNMALYALGVNAALEGWDGPLPPEFLLLRFGPEEWSPMLVQGIEKIMAWDLSDYQTGLNLAAAREELGDSALAPLMPSYPDWGVTIVDGWPEEAGEIDAEETGGGRGDALETAVGPARAATTDRTASPLPPRTPAALLAQATLAEDVARILELGSTVRASNSWVVGGERSRSGKPLLANDMHLALAAPNIWFLVGLHAPGYEVVGMSIPGAPGVVAGHSNAVAWGYTNAMVDDVDFYLEEVNPENPDEYLTPFGWESFDTREEIIQVRGGDPVIMNVRSSLHGPVITPVENRVGDRVVSFRWVAHELAGTFQALIGMGQAADADAFLRSMRLFDNPHQNVVFADTAGSWGYWMGGRVPVRASGPPPHLPVPGWTGEHEWVDWVPFEEKPHVLAPERGYIATANNAQGRDERAARANSGHWAGPYRAQRISELIEATELHDARSLLAIQMHAGSAFTTRYKVYAADAFRDAGMEELAAELESWDGVMGLESTRATLFHTWWRVLRRSFMEDYYAGGSGYFPSAVLGQALEGTGAIPLPDGLAEEAAREAAGYADLPWGEAHQLSLPHPMGDVPLVGSLLRFGRSGIPRVGAGNSVNVAPFSGTRPPFTTSYGPSQRHVVDMADVDGSGGFILPGGQSGYPANPHAFDQLELWREGRLWLLPLERGLVEGRTVATVRLEPAGG